MRYMYVLVGTSLYHSASWDPDRLPDTVPSTVKDGLRRWVEDDDGTLRESPTARRGDAPTLENEIRQALSPRNAADWARALPEGLATTHPMDLTGPLHPMRFSAELSTMLLMAQLSYDFIGEAVQDVQSFLKESSYAQLRVVTSGSTDDESYRAAVHLTSYLARLGAASDLHVVRGIDSRDPDVMLPALYTLVKTIVGDLDKRHQVDVVVSGGYKIFGVVLGGVHRDGLKLTYIHERGSRLIIHENARVRVPTPGGSSRRSIDRTGL